MSCVGGTGNAAVSWWGVRRRKSWAGHVALTRNRPPRWSGAAVLSSLVGDWFHCANFG